MLQLSDMQAGPQRSCCIFYICNMDCLRSRIKAADFFLRGRIYSLCSQREVRAMWKGKGEHEDRRERVVKGESFFFFFPRRGKEEGCGKN